MSQELELRVSNLEMALKNLEQRFDAKPPAHVLTSPELHKCCEVWRETLSHFGINRIVLPHEHVKCSQLVKQYGATAVMYAFFGARFEEATASFKPENNVSIARFFDDKIFEKLLNQGAKHREKEKKLAEAEKLRSQRGGE